MKLSLLIMIALLTGVYITVEGQLRELLVRSVGNTDFLGGQLVKRIIDLPEDRLMILTITVIHIVSLRISSDGSTVSTAGDDIELVTTTLAYSFQDALLLNDTHVLFIHKDIPCLKAVDINNGDIRTYAGNCSESGTQDGSLLEARFTDPRYMVRAQQIIYVNSANSTVMRLFFGELVSTVQIDYFNMVRDVRYMFSCEGTYSYITFSHGLAQLNLASNVPVVLSGSVDAGFSDGNLVNSEFDSPYGLAMLGPDIILVADLQNKRLRILDRSNNNVESVCNGNQESVDGTRLSCSFFFPFSLHLYKEIILIGELAKIRFIERRSIVTDSVFDRTKCSNAEGDPSTTQDIRTTTIPFVAQTSTTTSDRIPVIGQTSDRATSQSITSQASRISKKNTTGLVIGILVAVVCLVLIAGGIYLLVRKKYGGMQNFRTRMRSNADRMKSKVGNYYNKKPIIDEQKSQPQNMGSSAIGT